MTQRTSPRPPALLRSWLKFLVTLTLLTLTLRLLGSAWLVPDGLWPRAWWWGLRFDLAIAALLAGLTVVGLWLPTRLGFIPPRRGWLVPAGVLLLGAHLGDWLYWQETGRHIGYEAAELFNSAGSATQMLALHWPWLLALVAVTALLSLLAWVPSGKPGRGPRLELSLLVVLALSVLLVRGGPSGVPQGPHDAMRLADAREATAALNGAYSALHGLQSGHDALRQWQLEWLDDAQAEVAALYGDRRPATGAAPGEPLNLIVVLLESWSSVHMQPLTDGTPVTPHFDAIAARSLAGRELVSGGMRTTEGMFAIFCSYQNPLGQTLARTPQALNDYDCLPRRLRDAGWHTAFFQGSHENTSSVGAYAQSLGFTLSQGKGDIDTRRHDENAWGVYDGDLYRHVLASLETLPEPMMLGINTNTTHDTQLHDAAPRLTAGDRHLDVERNVLHLADRELGDFVTALEAREWQHPWALLLVSDHSARVQGSALERALLPFALYMPDRVAPGEPGRIAHQRDLAPTLAELLGMPLPHAMGHSLFDDEAPQIADFFLNGALHWFADTERLVEIPLADPDQARCHAWRASPELDRPLPCGEADRAAIRRAYGLTQQAQARLFAGEALTLVP
ncbi:LTA synthase family protein [Halomonas sp. 328]|uniref:LTA synthase family protein n=1 Tax=Halomonas sp. 328 TaxID=2776704 RepID=UPI0018A755DA|nr:LTA synthase family protein [Halomonas sp. 328]MBF8222151.1 LTA synthase family protein [Halomonas sp. 328]